jgi:steroid 5-alpha reductase family enzyme
VCSLQRAAADRAPRQLLATSMVCVWAVRLGSHLFMRVLRDGHDSRFDGVRERPLVFINLWTIQVVAHPRGTRAVSRGLCT